MSYQHLAVRREGPVEHLVLTRPEVRNAFNDAMVSELTAWADAVAGNPAVRVVVLSGAGAHFCAGADIAWMRRQRSASEEENLEDARRLSLMLRRLNGLPVPLIARVHGAALAGGTGLVAVCDIVVAAETSVFGFTEVRLGIVPAVISPFAIAKIGVSAARELFLTGARIPAARAREIGLVHAIVAEDALDATVDGYVRDVLAGAPGAIAAAKALIERVAWQSAGDMSELTARLIARQRVSPDGQEGLSAFLEKRSPSWGR
jgi:methylglutaconyl-CoA hydratase